MRSAGQIDLNGFDAIIMAEGPAILPGSAIAYDNCSNITPFSLGTDVLRRLRLLVGSKREEIHVTAADASLAP